MWTWLSEVPAGSPGGHLAHLTGGSRAQKGPETRQGPSGQGVRPGGHVEKLSGAALVQQTHLSQEHARQEEVPKTEARIGTVPPVPHPPFRTPFGPQRGTFIHRRPVWRWRPCCSRNPSLTGLRFCKSPPQSPTAAEMWVCWGQAGAGAYSAGRCLQPRFLQPLKAPFRCRQIRTQAGPRAGGSQQSGCS